MIMLHGQSILIILDWMWVDLAHQSLILMSAYVLWFLLVLILYDSVNNISVMSGQVFLGWTSTKQGLMCLAQGHKQWRHGGSNPQPLGLKSSTLPLSHCASSCLLVAYIVNNMDPDQTAPFGADWSGFILFASMKNSSLKTTWVYAADLKSRRNFQVCWYWYDSTSSLKCTWIYAADLKSRQNFQENRVRVKG